MTESESWRAEELVRRTGLIPLRNELRPGKMGNFRFCVFFAATGDPILRCLDDGTWDACQARLVEVGPPKRPSAKTATASKNSKPLPPTAVWGRQVSLSTPSARLAVAPDEPMHFSPQAPAVSTPPGTPAVSAGRRRQRQGRSGSPPARRSSAVSPNRNEDRYMQAETAFFNASASSSTRNREEPPRRTGQGNHLSRRSRNGPVASTPEDKIDKMLDALAELRQQNENLQRQLTTVLEENAQLRRQLLQLVPQSQAQAPTSAPLVPPSFHASEGLQGHGHF